MRKKVFNFLSGIILLIILLTLTGFGNAKNAQNNQGSQSDINNKESKDSLASKVKVGDYVDYKTVADNKYTSESDKTGYSEEQVFVTTGEEKWRVLEIADDGTVTLISEKEIKTNTNDTYYLIGAKGYENSVSELNNIAAIYGNGENAVSARHITREDINNLIGLEKFATFANVDVSTYSNNEEKWNAIFEKINENYGKELTIVSTDTNKQFKVDTAVAEGKTEIDRAKETPNYYEIKLSDLEEDNKVYQEILNGRYWLANKIIKYVYSSNIQGISEYFNYEVGYLSSASSSNGKFNLDAEYDSVSLVCGGKYSIQPGLTNYNRSVRPVVVLDKDVKCDGGTGTASDPFIIK